MAKPGPRSASNANGQPGTHPVTRNVDPSKAGHPGSTNPTEQPIPGIKDARAVHENLVSED